MKKKIRNLFYTSLFLMFTGIIANPVLLSRFFSSDGILESSTVWIILIFDLCIFLLGLSMYLKNSFMPLKLCTLLLCSVLLAAVSLEICLRVYWHYKPFSFGTMHLPLKKWIISPDMRLNYFHGQYGEIIYTTYTGGFREYPEFDPDAFRILVIGDSFTAAMEVSDGKCYYHQLQGLSPQIDVYAWGCGGYGTLQEYLEMDRYIDAIKPDLILWQLTENDLMDNDYELGALCYGNNLYEFERPFLINGEIQYLYPRKEPWVIRQLKNNFILPVELTVRYKKMKMKLWGDYYSKGLKLHDPIVRKSIETTSSIFDLIVKRTRGIPLIAFCASELPDGEFKKMCEEKGIRYIEKIGKYLNTCWKEGIRVDGRDWGDYHWTAWGHKLAGKKIAEYLTENRIVPELKQTRFGEKKWRFNTVSQVYKPAFSGETLYTLSAMDHLYAIDAADGKELWRLKSGHDPVMPPVMNGSTLYCGIDRAIIAEVETGTGNIVKFFNLIYPVENRAVIENDLLYATSPAGKALAFDLKTGKSLWTFSAGDNITSEPVLSEEFVYFGCHDGFMYCLNRKDGTLAWKFKTSGEFRAPPVVMGDRIFFSAREDMVYALDRKTGAKHWSFNCEADLVTGVILSGNHDVIAGNCNGKVFSINRDNGSLSWVIQHEGKELLEPVVYGAYLLLPFIGQNSLDILDGRSGRKLGILHCGFKLSSAPVLHGDVLYVPREHRSFDAIKITALPRLDESVYQENVWDFRTGCKNFFTVYCHSGMLYLNSDTEYLYAIDADSGKESWRKKTGRDTALRPVGSGNLLYFGLSDSAIVALNRTDGSERLVFQLSATAADQPAIDEKRLYAACSDGKVISFDLETGKEIWNFDVSDNISISPVITGESLYIGGHSKKFYCLNKMDGRLIWDFDAEGEFRNLSAIGGNMIFVAARSDTLYALDRKTGNKTWEFDSKADIVTDITVTGRHVLAGNCEGKIFCLDRSDGSLIWEKEFSGSEPMVLLDYGKFLFAAFREKADISVLNLNSGSEVGLIKCQTALKSEPVLERDVLYVPVEDDTVRKIRLVSYTNTMFPGTEK